MSLTTGIIENPPQYSIIGARYYGYPIVWRVIMVTMPSQTNVMLTNLAIDAVFWVIVSFVALIVLMKMSKRYEREHSGTMLFTDKTRKLSDA